ncbi:restriction endonuclease subunit M [Synergistales bacterium]|nr:restriction endonuclease subunit M [Synergistales bacterium]
MNYIGSKHSLLGFLETSIDEITGGTAKTFCDIFAGTGSVGVHFKKKGYRVIANDLQYYSYVLNRHYIGNSEPMTFSGIIDALFTTPQLDDAVAVFDYLNNLDGVKGFIYNNYCVGETAENPAMRQYYSNKNGSRADAIRTQIELWKAEGRITCDEYYFLLASLLEAIDKVANTASVYGAFLKKLKKSAEKDLEFIPVNFIQSEQEHTVLNLDANTAARQIKTDILYLDPPYNQRQYATNYHCLETIARYDNPRLHGKSGLRDYAQQKSLYCSRVGVKAAFADLIQHANAKYIFLSYNNEGLLSPADIREVMRTRGEYGVYTQEYKRFRADDDGANRKYAGDITYEYLHYVVCG